MTVGKTSASATTATRNPVSLRNRVSRLADRSMPGPSVVAIVSPQFSQFPDDTAHQHAQLLLRLRSHGQDTLQIDRLQRVGQADIGDDRQPERAQFAVYR